MEVALEPVPRKESLSVAMEKIWALDGQYRTFCVPPVRLAFREELRSIRVCLGYELGRVTFCNADLAVCKKGKCSGRESGSEGTLEEQQEPGGDGDL